MKEIAIIFITVIVVLFAAAGCINLYKKKKYEKTLYFVQTGNPFNKVISGLSESTLPINALLRSTATKSSSLIVIFPRPTEKRPKLMSFFFTNPESMFLNQKITAVGYSGTSRRPFGPKRCPPGRVNLKSRVFLTR